MELKHLGTTTLGHSKEERKNLLTMISHIEKSDIPTINSQ
jgi:hypothetical protein